MTLSKRSYALVNGLNMYYEIHGEGQPLVLLHGALSAMRVYTSWHWKVADDASCQNKVMKKGRMLSRDGVCHTMTADMTCLFARKEQEE